MTQQKGFQYVPPPRWPESSTAGARRVLVEHPEPAARELIARGLRDRGHEVVSCGGPDAHGATRTDGCPVLLGERCPGLEGADVVVTSLNLAKDRDGMIVRAIVRDPAGPPVLVEGTDRWVRETLGPDLRASNVRPFTSVDEIARVIEELPAGAPGSLTRSGPT